MGFIREKLKNERELTLFILVVACLGVMAGVYENTFSNYLKDVYHISEKARGFLEFPRELPGFLVALFSGLLFFMPAERMGALAVAGIGVGLVGQAFLAPSYSWVIIWMVIWSWGTHLFLPLQSSIGMLLAKDGQYGRKLGQLQGINTLAVIIGCALIWLIFRVVKWSYPQAFLVAAIFAFIAAGMLWAMKPHGVGTKKQRFVLKRCYSRFYVLSVIWGARKQVFLTFAPWVLIQIYHQTPETFATLIMVASAIGVVLQPLLGRAIDHFGERTIFIVEGLAMAGVCVGYAVSDGIFGSWALYALFVFYMLDRFLMTISMARATYLKKILDDPEDLNPTLSMGISIDHAVSMTVPALGGILWAHFGYPIVFYIAALIALGNLIVAWNMQKASAETINSKTANVG